MTTEQVRKMMGTQPFRPFEMYLAEGRFVPVAHPECLMFSSSGRTVVVALPDDTFEIVDLLVVTSLRYKTNGAAKRRSA